jgi:alginate O-acetyltransferase complex protein AlgI
MSFTSWQYIVFLGAVLALVRVVRPHRAQLYLLLAASCAFYAFWDVRFVPLLLAMACVTYLVAARIAVATTARGRRSWLVAGIGIDLGVLGVFKYYGFFGRNLAALLHTAPPSSLGIILPVGISFVTFEVLSYLIDVYRGEPQAASMADFALLVMFFPHLVSGPILKPGKFLPQLGKRFDVSWTNIEEALPGFLMGLAKKAVLADGLARFVDPVFAAPRFYSSATVWLAVTAYALQIYFDFSGYSDMAIASAKCFGLEIPRNFDMPYLSRNIAEFWRRWHISLSTWFRHYVYYPLGGSRRALPRVCLNLFVIMLLSGLWHGAGWNFVVWGALHGIALAAHRAFRALVPRKAGERDSWLGIAAAWLLTMLFLCVSWVFFRSADFGLAFVILGKMAFVGDVGGIAWIPPSLVLALVATVAGYWVGLTRGLPKRLEVLSFAGAATLVLVVMAVMILAPDTASPFIYFQF